MTGILWLANQTDVKATLNDDFEIVVPTKINNWIIDDYHRLKSNFQDGNLFDLNAESFIKLFLQGLEGSFQMHQDFIESKTRYPEVLKMGMPMLTDLSHPLPKRRLRLLKKGHLKSNRHHYEVFADFRGMWHGKWKENKVDQSWQSPRYVDEPLGFEGFNDLSLKAFQTVHIGDGIGWNYTVEKAGKTIVLGFTFHFNEHNEIYLRRPHLGFVQKKNTLLWLTKDHIYIEFICKSKKCKKLPLHYSISGLSFEKSREKLTLKEAFQAIYTTDPKVRPTFQIGTIKNSR